MKRRAYIGFGCYMIMVLLNAYLVLLYSKQYIYSLSLMPREDAYHIAYTASIHQLETLGIELPHSVIETYTRSVGDNYMAQVGELKDYEKLALAQKGNIAKVGTVIGTVTIVTLIYTDLKGAKDADRKDIP